MVGGARRCGLLLLVVAVVDEEELLLDGRAKDTLNSEEKILAQLQVVWVVCLRYQLYKKKKR